MKTKFFALLVLALSASVLGCSSHYSSLDSEGEQTLYELEESVAFQLAQSAILKVLPGRNITNIDGQTIGYSTWYRFGLDKYTQQVLVVPITGLTESGERISGYYFDVSGSGTSAQGRAKNASLWKTLIASADSSGSKRRVSNVKPNRYTSDDPFTSKDSESASQANVFDSLERLKQLHLDEAITDEEYETQRKKLLERI